MRKGRKPNYDKWPFVAVPDGTGHCVQGWEAIGDRLWQAGGRVIVVECYPGVNEESVLCELRKKVGPALTVDCRELLKSPEEIDRMVAPFTGGDDPVFGFMCGLTLPQFVDSAKLEAAREAVKSASGKVLIVGVGASMVADGDLLVYADLARWEAQLRFRRNESANLGSSDPTVKAGQQYKQAFFVDWRVADRWKRPLIAKWDFVLDTTDARTPKMADGEAVRRGLDACCRRPFRVVPFFDPAPWGGQWMKEVCDLDPGAPNYGWCFDCVPEENSLLLGFGDHQLEIPSVDALYRDPRNLLGDKVYARFGDEFPIRFDFLDTIEGGNLSFQVHPTTEYIQHAFGMHYTQDESYYMLDAEEDATVYLGLKDGVDLEAMFGALEEAQNGGAPFEAERFANRWPAKKHDHFLIPAGTVHCSGRSAMVLEISATPYIFTFKLWDWGRLGLDGKPRPIYLNHGRQVVDPERTTRWTRENLIDRFVPVAEGEGWREERTGLHEMEFIETRRHWFDRPVPHHTGGGVNVLNLVEGEEAVVESPTGAFEPFPIHYAETFIVPAAVGAYTIRPLDSGPHATMKAYVRS